MWSDVLWSAHYTSDAYVLELFVRLIVTYILLGSPEKGPTFVLGGRHAIERAILRHSGTARPFRRDSLGRTRSRPEKHDVNVIRHGIRGIFIASLNLRMAAYLMLPGSFLWQPMSSTVPDDNQHVLKFQILYSHLKQDRSLVSFPPTRFEAITRTGALGQEAFSTF